MVQKRLLAVAAQLNPVVIEVLHGLPALVIATSQRMLSGVGVKRSVTVQGWPLASTRVRVKAVAWLGRVLFTTVARC